MKKSTVTDRLLCILMHQPKLLDHPKVDRLRFENQDADLFNAVRVLWVNDKNPTPEALSLMKLPDSVVDFATGLYAREVPDVSFEQLLDTVLDEQKMKDIAGLCSKYHRLAVAGEVSAADLMTQMFGETLSMASIDSESAMSLGSDFTSFEEELRWRQDNPGKIRGLSTGFDRLDRVLNGLRRKAYYILGARPSVGKTAWMCNVIEANCEAGLAVGTWSIEMPKDQLQQRCLAAMSRVNMSSYSDTVLTMQDLRLISAAQRKMKKWRWWVNDNQDCSIDQIEAQATMLARQKNLDLIAIDYLQIINIASKDDRYEQVGEISKRIRNLGRRLNVPTVALAQLRRKDGKFKDSINKTIFPPPEMSDLRESGNLEQDADGIMLLDRDIRDEEEKRKARLDVAKNRGGSTTHKPLPFKYTPELTLFSEEQ